MGSTGLETTDRVSSRLVWLYSAVYVIRDHVKDSLRLEPKLEPNPGDGAHARSIIECSWTLGA
jgi:hypothetical protein